LQWRQEIFSLYSVKDLTKDTDTGGNRQHTVRSYCAEILQDMSQYRRIIYQWQEVLELDKLIALGHPPKSAEVLAKVDKVFPLEQEQAINGGNKSNERSENEARDLRPSSASILLKNEEDLFCEFVAELARNNCSPLEIGDLKEIVDKYLDCESRNTLGSNGVSLSTIWRIYQNGNLRAKRNVYCIDPKRTQQACFDVLNEFYYKAGQAKHLAHAINPSAWPEGPRIANTPKTRMFNADEQGPNTSKHRRSVLIPNALVPRSGSNIVEISPNGDLMKKNLIAIITCLKYILTTTRITWNDGCRRHFRFLCAMVA
jgi:hypothetical protein